MAEDYAKIMYTNNAALITHARTRTHTHNIMQYYKFSTFTNQR